MKPNKEEDKRERMTAAIAAVVVMLLFPALWRDNQVLSWALGVAVGLATYVAVRLSQRT